MSFVPGKTFWLSKLDKTTWNILKFESCYIEFWISLQGPKCYLKWLQKSKLYRKMAFCSHFLFQRIFSPRILIFFGQRQNTKPWWQQAQHINHSKNRKPNQNHSKSTLDQTRFTAIFFSRMSFQPNQVHSKGKLTDNQTNITGSYVLVYTKP